MPKNDLARDIDRAVYKSYDAGMAIVGRPKEFDREEALDKAMELFWTRGYEATGMRELLQHMGIGRQSLYDTFGDKHSLFIEAVKQYNRRVTQGIVDRLKGDGSPLEKVQSVVRSIGNAVTDGHCRGCLLTNTLIEAAPHDPEIAKAAKTILDRLESTFRLVLQQAVEDGELPNDANVRALARYLTSTIQGLVVMGKASVSRAAVKDIVHVALSVLNR